MRLNGLWVVVEMALRALAEPRLDRWRTALVMGSMREDVWYLPTGRVLEHLSFTHFYQPGLPGGFVPFLWPSPHARAEKFYRRALAAHRAGNEASACVSLGRVLHLITDMACPVHATRTIHTTDPFEWWVEGNARRLLELPVPELGEVSRPSEATLAMAHATQGHHADGTNSLHGSLLGRLGWRRPVKAPEAAEQARTLIPLAAGHAVSFMRLYLRETA